MSDHAARIYLHAVAQAQESQAQHQNGSEKATCEPMSSLPTTINIKEALLSAYVTDAWLRDPQYRVQFTLMTGGCIAQSATATTCLMTMTCVKPFWLMPMMQHMLDAVAFQRRKTE
jgi:hypothetical protein